MFKKFHLITIVVAFCCVVVFLGCPSGSGGGGGGGTLHTYADASPEMTALFSGLADAAVHTSGSAYITTSSSVSTYHFSNYVYNGITLNGSLTLDTTSFPETEIGTINCTGGTVSQIIYNIYISSSSVVTGTYTIKFNDGTSWSYDYGTGTFTGI